MSRDPQTDGPSVLCFVSRLPPLLCPSPYLYLPFSYCSMYSAPHPPNLPPVKAQEMHGRFFESLIIDSIQDIKFIIPKNDFFPQPRHTFPSDIKAYRNNQIFFDLYNSQSLSFFGAHVIDPSFSRPSTPR